MYDEKHKKMAETLIDTIGVTATLELLAEVCKNKADLIFENLNNKQAVKDWISAGSDIQQLTRVMQRHTHVRKRGESCIDSE
jgi:hypothetical protein